MAWKLPSFGSSFIPSLCHFDYDFLQIYLIWHSKIRYNFVNMYIYAIIYIKPLNIIVKKVFFFAGGNLGNSEIYMKFFKDKVK